MEVAEFKGTTDVEGTPETALGVGNISGLGGGTGNMGLDGTKDVALGFLPGINSIAFTLSADNWLVTADMPPGGGT